MWGLGGEFRPRAQTHEDDKVKSNQIKRKADSAAKQRLMGTGSSGGIITPEQHSVHQSAINLTIDRN